LIVNKHNEDIGNCQVLIYFDGISSSVIKLTLLANRAGLEKLDRDISDKAALK
jgi:hypothetical protein